MGCGMICCMRRVLQVYSLRLPKTHFMLKTFKQTFSPKQALSYSTKSFRSSIPIWKLVWLSKPGALDACRGTLSISPFSCCLHSFTSLTLEKWKGQVLPALMDTHMAMLWPMRHKENSSEKYHPPHSAFGGSYLKI